MGKLPISGRDYVSGGLMALIGLYAVVQGISYRMGTLSNMGPGFVPVCVGGLLILIGGTIAGGAIWRPAQADAKAVTIPPNWRGYLCITTGVIAFIILGNFFGLVPASLALVFISALGDRKSTLKSAAILSMILTMLSVALFWWILQIPFPLFQAP